jgi:Tfp pilus assembly protein PilO
MSNTTPRDLNPSKYSKYFTSIKPILRNKYTRNYSYFFFSFIVSAFFIIFVLQPTISTIISLRKSIVEQQQVLNQLEKKIDDLSAAKNNYLAIDQTTRDNLFTLVPNVPAIPLLINNLDSLAVQNQATISGIQFQPTDLVPKNSKFVKTATLNTIDLNVNSQGSYTQLRNLIGDLTSLNRLFSFQNIVFNSVEDQLMTSITAKSYYIKN